MVSLPEVIFKDKSSYIGNWKNGKKEGFGIKKFSDGTIYEGEWANN